LSSVTDVINKLKQLPQALISQFVVVLLLIYIASIVANVSWLLLPSGESVGDISSTQVGKATGSPRNATSSNNISGLTSLHVFGAHVKEDNTPVVVETQVQEVIPKTRLDLTLSGTVAEGNNSGKGTAVIASAGSQSTYGIDDKINASTAIVKQVYTDRVIIQNGPMQETLMLDGIEYDNRNVGSEVKKNHLNAPKHKNGNSSRLNVKGSQRQSNRKNTNIKYKTSGKKIDKRKDRALAKKLAKQREDVNKDPKKLFDLIRFSPVRKGGSLVGYRLNPGAEPGLFKQAGFKPNDLAVEVNGFDLSDMRQAMTAMREFRDMTEANIIVERDGLRTEILFSLDGSRQSSAGTKR
jgi:general secretion pathway protein C